MAWYTDEQYEMIKDSREKKSIAASAFKQKTHCGKGGRVKFPSDYLSKKELKAMSGECKSYRMNDPMSWSEFVEWPNEHKIAYIKRIREKFGVSDQYIAEMFGVATNLFLMYLKELGLEPKRECDEQWERNKFYAWRTGAKTELVNEDSGEEEAEARNDIYPYRPMPWSDFKKSSDENKINYIKWLRETFNTPDKEIAELFDVGYNTIYRHFKALELSKGVGSGNKCTEWNKEGYMKWRNREEVIEEETPVSVPLSEVVDEAKAERIEELCQEVMETIEREAAAVEPQEDPVRKAFEEAKARYEEAIRNYIHPVEPVENTMEERIREAGPIAFAGNPIPVIPKSGSMSFERNYAEDILTTLKTMLGDVRVNMTVTWECEF